MKDVVKMLSLWRDSSSKPHADHLFKNRCDSDCIAVATLISTRGTSVLVFVQLHTKRPKARN